MALLLSDVKAAVQARGYPSDSTSSALQTVLVQEALRSLYGDRQWPFMVSTSTSLTATVANAGVVALTSLGTSVKVQSVRLVDGQDELDLNAVDDVEVERLRHVDQETDVPDTWTQVGTNLVLYPRPSRTMTLHVRYSAMPTLPTADGNTLAWPDEHLDVIVLYVLRELAARQRDGNLYDRYNAQFADAKGRLFRNQAESQLQSDLEVQSVDGFSDYFS